MGFKVVLSPQAIERLGEVIRYIAHEYPSASERFGMWLVAPVPLLVDFPELGTPFSKRPGVRRLLCKLYFIHYRLQEHAQVLKARDCWHSVRKEPESR